MKTLTKYPTHPNSKALILFRKKHWLLIQGVQKETFDGVAMLESDWTGNAQGHPASAFRAHLGIGGVMQK